MAKQKMVSIEIELEQDVLLALCMEAHKQDITLNKLVSKILKEYIKNEKRKET